MPARRRGDVGPKNRVTVDRYADATLVVLAEEIGTDLVFTTDRRDFTVYRIRGRLRFRIVPD
jgi:hypothetical protein